MPDNDPLAEPPPAAALSAGAVDDGGSPASLPPPPARSIRTPWRIQWARFREQLLPLLVFLLALLLTVWMWRRHAGLGHGIGAVEGQKATILSSAGGRLAPPATTYRKFDRVKAGDVVARLEAGALFADKAAKETEVNRLRTAIQAHRTPGATRPAQTPEALQSAVAVALDELRAIESRLEALDLRSPIDGMVMQVLRHPGDAVIAGEPIMEIASDQGTHVVSYVRQSQAVQPVAGMTVEIRATTPGARVLSGRVEAIGARVELVPEHQLRDPKTMEWGLPIRVTLPTAAKLRPGELVSLTFKPPQPGAAATASQ